jgi:hydroxymethylglutaryl-CoA synthase
MGMNAIECCGAYVPRYRIDASEFTEAWGAFQARGVSEKAVAESDEDAVTMAVEAIERALATSEYSRDDVDTLAIGTTTPPVDEGDVAAQVAEISGLRRSVELSTHTQSTRAGTAALTAAVESGSSLSIAVAADCPIGAPDGAIDHAAGAGAVALLIAEDGPVSIEESASYAHEFPGTRFRQRGQTNVESYDATAFERDAYTSVVAGAVDALDHTGAALAPTAPDGSMPYRAGRAVGGEMDVYEQTSSLGDTGAASSLFSLLAAWQDGEDDVVVVGYGDGASANAFRLAGSISVEMTRETTSITYDEYLRKRGHVVSDTGGVN